MSSFELPWPAGTGGWDVSHVIVLLRRRVNTVDQYDVLRARPSRMIKERCFPCGL